MFALQSSPGVFLYLSLTSGHREVVGNHGVPASNVIVTNIFWSLDPRGFRIGWLSREEIDRILSEGGSPLEENSDRLLTFASEGAAQDWLQSQRPLRGVSVVQIQQPVLDWRTR